jgi:acetyl-CoA carboxylase biotin carboxyl carrier protein
MADLRNIKKLIELIEETGIAEIEISKGKNGEETVRISKMMPGMQQIAAPQAMPAPIADTLPIEKPPEKNTADALADKHTVDSPMVGSVYLSASPGGDPFIEVGQSVNKGDTLCLIEAMKMYNQIEADISGTVTARLIDNASPVEFGQPLFIIE